jgi:hypothetical protein
MACKPRTKIPKFKSIAEEAALWDAYDSTDFEDEFEEVAVEFADSLLQRGLTVALEKPYLSQLEDLVGREQRQAAALAREWLIERLRVVEA